GIRDLTVTGVQTYALPIFFAELGGSRGTAFQSAFTGVVLPRVTRIVFNLTRRDLHHADGIADHVSGSFLSSRSFGHAIIIAQVRSEERRVGKECRCGCVRS